MARVSIITALYNHEKYVAQAIESVRAQTYADWELLLWDDGSLDGSLALAQKIASDSGDKRIKVFTHPGGVNRGQENTRNAALEHASGELLCLLDSDDLYYPRKLERLVPCFERPQVGLAYGDFDCLLEKSGRRVPSGIARSPEGKVFAALAYDNFIGANASMFRRACLERGLRFDSEFRTTGEYPLWLKIARDWELAHVGELVATWRDHGENLGTKLALQAKREQVRLFERLSQAQEYAGYARELAVALAKRHYDLAAVCYEQRETAEARRACLKALSAPGATPVLRAKAAALLALSSLPDAAASRIAKVKTRFWRWRHGRDRDRT